MKKYLYIDNFKCFEKQKIEFGNLTILAGANSVGKSSVIQSLLLLKAAEEIIALTKSNIPLNDKYNLSLGTAKEVLYRESANDNINIVFSEKDLDDSPTEDKNYWTFVNANKVENPSFLTHKPQKEAVLTTPAFGSSVYYLNAERIGPRLRYEIGTDYTHIGYKGEYSIYVLDSMKSEKMTADDIRVFGVDDALTYSRQVELWMKNITTIPDNITTEILDTIATALVKYGHSSAPNVGFGISYVLPIILNGLIAEPGSTMIVENPEAHLHPLGQSRIGQFLGRVAAAGVHVIIETHSEHIINGVRIATINDVLPNEEVIINFFSRETMSVQPMVSKIGINQMGDLTKFPYGFFDQTIHDMTTIVKARKNKKNELKQHES